MSQTRGGLGLGDLKHRSGAGVVPPGARSRGPGWQGGAEGRPLASPPPACRRAGGRPPPGREAAVQSRGRRAGSASSAAARGPLSVALPRGKEGGGTKRRQDRKQSQQVTWQVLGELRNESPYTNAFFFLL